MAYTKEIRLAAVEYARRHSVKETARTFRIARNTVRRWYRERYPAIKPTQTTPELEDFTNLQWR